MKINRPIYNIAPSNYPPLTPMEKLEIKCCQLEKENEDLKKEIKHLEEMYEILNEIIVKDKK